MKTLEELKAEWDAAKAKADAAPEDKALEAAAQAAEAAYNAKKAETDKEGEEDDDGIDDSKLDDQTKAYIEKLRKENAKARVKNKELVSRSKTSDERLKAVLKAAGIEEESEEPEVKVKTLTAETQTLAFRNAVLELAVEQGIPKENLEFFEFLMAKAVGELEEGDELSDETLADIIKKAQGGNAGSKANTSVGGGKEKPKPGESGEVDLAKFLAMGINERSLLYSKHPEKYLKLTEEAKAKGKKLV